MKQLAKTVPGLTHSFPKPEAMIVKAICFLLVNPRVENLKDFPKHLPKLLLFQGDSLSSPTWCELPTFAFCLWRENMHLFIYLSWDLESSQSTGMHSQSPFSMLSELLAIWTFLGQFVVPLVREMTQKLFHTNLSLKEGNLFVSEVLCLFVWLSVLGICIGMGGFSFVPSESTLEWILSDGHTYSYDSIS